MKAETKALIIGVSLRYRDIGIGAKTYDSQREAKFTEAIRRLKIDTHGLEPGNLSDMLDSYEQVLEWLAEHPDAVVDVGRWMVTIFSPRFDDVDHERFDCPFDNSCAVEDFSKGKAKGGWDCCWSFC